MRLNRIQALSVFLALFLLVVLPLHADWIAEGNAQYRDREFSSIGFSGVEPLRPIRFADVEILDAVALSVLASGTTDDQGNFSIPVVDGQVRDVQVRILTRGDETTDLFLEVSNAAFEPYAIISPISSAHSPDASLNFGTLVAEIGQGGEAFNCWDVGLLGTDYIAFLQGSRPGSFDALRIVWEPSRGQPASTASAFRIDVRDTGPYDDTVILHEYGHFAVFNFSVSNNPGGSHGFAQCDQDPQLAWEEGHASFFGCSARKHFGLALPNIYVRTTGAAGPGHVSLYADLETETEFECDGSTSEVAVFTALWDIFDGVSEQDFTPGVDDLALENLELDDREHWEVMTGGLPGRSRISAEDYWDAWFEAPILNGFHAEMKTIFGTGVGIEYFEDLYEPNDSLAVASPIAADGTLIHATFFSDPDGDGSGAEIREVDWFSFVTPSGVVYEVETLNLWSAADTSITITDESGSTLASNDDRSSGDPSSFLRWTAPGDGTFYVEVSQPNDFTPYGSYDLRVVESDDTDNDGIPNDEDACPADPDNDVDADGFCGDVDNCATAFNPGQADMDADFEGDLCDLDDGMIYITINLPDRVEWHEEAGFGKWNTYRGDLALLRTGGPYTQDALVIPLASKTCKNRDPWIEDLDSLAPGEAVFFLTAGLSGNSEGDLGLDSFGALRPNENACP